jgi:hypothetical protein
MKRFLFFVLVAVLAIVFAGASSIAAVVDHGPKNVVKDIGNKTVDSQYTGNWDPIDSFVIVKDTAGTCIYEVSGDVKLYAYDVLYINLGNDSANRVSAATAATTGQTNENAVDTFIVGGFIDIPAPIWLPFRAIVLDSAAACTDTFYINMATGQAKKPITVKNVTVRRY